MSLIDSTRRTIRRYGLLPRHSRVVIALSGGADSVALLYALKELAASEAFHVTGAAHLNHQLRGPDSEDDEEFCRRMSKSLDIPLHVERLDIAALAGAAGVSIEHVAHDARHEFFARAAALSNASAVAVAHTKNDQAETFLLRLLRGAGPRGLGGMHPRSGVVVRPFIDSDRSSVRAFLEAGRIPFREDASNSDRSIPRNRIRHELLPFLEAHFSPAIIDVLDREAAIAREDAEYLDAAAAAIADRLISRTRDGVDFPDAVFLTARDARRVIRWRSRLRPVDVSWGRCRRRLIASRCLSLQVLWIFRVIA